MSYHAQLAGPPPTVAAPLAPQMPPQMPPSPQYPAPSMAATDVRLRARRFALWVAPIAVGALIGGVAGHLSGRHAYLGTGVGAGVGAAGVGGFLFGSGAFNVQY